MTRALWLSLLLLLVYVMWTRVSRELIVVIVILIMPIQLVALPFVLHATPRQKPRLLA